MKCAGAIATAWSSQRHGPNGKAVAPAERTKADLQHAWHHANTEMGRNRSDVGEGYEKGG